MKRLLLFLSLFTTISVQAQTLPLTLSWRGNTPVNALDSIAYTYTGITPAGYKWLYPAAYIRANFAPITGGGYVPNSRQIINGYGITGGHSLATDVTLAVDTPNIVSKTYFNTRIGIATAASIATKATIATTLAGYGITDAYTKTVSDARFLGILATAENSYKLNNQVFNFSGLSNKDILQYNSSLFTWSNVPANTYLTPAGDGSGLSGVTKRLGNVVAATMKTASSGSYTKVVPNTTYTFGSSYVTSAGGSGDIDNYMYYTGYVSNSTYFSMRDTIVGVTDGAGIGLGTDGTLSTFGYIILTGADKGKIAIRTNSTIRVTSTEALSYSNLTDSIELTFTRSLFTFIMTARVINDVSKTISISWLYPYTGGGGSSPIGNTFHPTIYSLGGTQHITGSHVYTVNEINQYKGLIYSHSIYAANADTISWSYQAQARFSGGVNIIAGSGTRVTDYVKLKPEIFSLNPKYIIFYNGINDLIDNVPVATIFTAIKSFINDCFSRDIVPVVMNVSPIGAATTGTGQTNAQLRARIDSLNALIATSEAPIKIDTYTPMQSGGFLNSAYGGPLHPNRAGHHVMYEALENGMKSFLSLDKFQGVVTEDQTFPQTIGATGARLKKLWATDIASTNPIVADITGNAPTSTLSANSTKWNGEDITTTGKAAGDLLQYDGTKFVNATVTATLPLQKSGSGAGGTWSIVKADATHDGYIDTATFNATPKVVAKYKANGKTNIGTLFTYNVPSDGAYRISLNLFITAISTNSLRYQMDYTHVTGQVQSTVSGAISVVTPTTSTGSIQIAGVILNLKAGTTFTIATQNPVSGGSNTYDVTTYLEKMP